MKSFESHQRVLAFAATLPATTVLTLKQFIVNSIRDATFVTKFFDDDVEALEKFLASLSYRVKAGHIAHVDGAQAAPVYLMTRFDRDDVPTGTDLPTYGVAIAQNTRRSYEAYGQLEDVYIYCAGACKVEIDLTLEN